MSDETANNQGRAGSETARALAQTISEHIVEVFSPTMFQTSGEEIVVPAETLAAEIVGLLARRDAQLVADLNHEWIERCKKFRAKDAAEAEARLADLTKPGPCEKPGHRMADCRPATLADNSENEFVCTACEREERERALAVGAALEQEADYLDSCSKESAADVLRARIPEASKKALADERERLIGLLEALADEISEDVKPLCGDTHCASPECIESRVSVEVAGRFRAAIARYKPQGGPKIQNFPEFPVDEGGNSALTRLEAEVECNKERQGNEPVTDSSLTHDDLRHLLRLARAACD